MKKFHLLLGLFLCFPFFPSNAEVWHRDIADSSETNKGYECSISTDSQNNPHISYYDGDFSDLRYAHFDGDNWLIDIVDSIGIVGCFSDIIIDNNDRPHIFYQKGYLNLSHTHIGLKYATLQDTGWATEFIDSVKFGIPGYNSSISMNSSNQPCCAYYNLHEQKLNFLWKSGNAWQFNTVTISSTISIPSPFIKLVFNSNNLPVIGFLNSENKISIAEMLSDSSWQIAEMPESPFFIPPYSWNDMAIDFENKIYILYAGIDFKQHTAIYNGTTWDIKSLENSTLGIYTSGITIDNNNIPHVLQGGDDLILYELAADIWEEKSLIDSSSNTSISYSSSLIFDNNNHLQIAIAGTPIGSNVDYSLIYYRFYPGDPKIHLPEMSHNYGSVALGSYNVWECSIHNNGNAPLIIKNATTSSGIFQIANSIFPLSIFPQYSKTITIKFFPHSETDYSGLLNLFSNDPDQENTQITLTGRGGSEDSTSSLYVKIWNTYFDSDHGVIDNNLPLSNASIILKRNGEIFGPFQTNNTGETTINDITPGTINVEIKSYVQSLDILKQIKKIKTIDLGPGINSLEVSLPDSLIGQKYEIIDQLSNIDKFSYPYSYAENEATTVSLLDDWHINTLPNYTEENLGRMILTEKMVLELFDDGYSIGNESINNLGELISYISYQESLANQIIPILVKILKAIVSQDSYDLMMELLDILIQKLVIQAVLDLATDGIQMVAAEIPFPGDELVMGAWKDVKNQYCDWGTVSFNMSNWNALKQKVVDILGVYFFQEIYIDILTGSTLEKGFTYSQNFNFSGNFDNAYENKINFVSDKKNEVEKVEEWARGLRTTANLFMKTSLAFEWAEYIATGIIADVLKNLRRGMQYSAYINVITAMGISSYEFFTLPSDMKDNVYDIYFPDGNPNKNLPFTKEIYSQTKLSSSYLSTEMKEELVSDLYNKTNAYDSLLIQIQENVQNNENFTAVKQLKKLIPTGEEYLRSIKLTASPIFSVADIASDSISNFSIMYDSLISNYTRLGESQSHAGLSLFFMGLDSTSEIQNLVLEQLQITQERTHQLTEQVESILDTISFSLPIPPVLAISYFDQGKQTLLENDTTRIKCKIKNTGSKTSENVSLILETSNGIIIENSDSIYIGSLDSGEESEIYTWNVKPARNGDQRATWTITPYSENAKSYSVSGSFSLKELVEETNIDSIQGINCYPNPFDSGNKNLHIQYQTYPFTKLKLEIFDIRGKLIYNQNYTSSSSLFNTLWNGRDNKGNVVSSGIYFILINPHGSKPSVKKIVILH